MATDISQIAKPAVVAECGESTEQRVLPALVEWRARETGAAATYPRARHAGAERADSIPREYALMESDELDRRISAARAALGDRLVILGHHYQRDEIIKYADARGDSFKLAQFAAARPEADYIVFCGVHFMAESADLLSGPHQQVILPNHAAGDSSDLYELRRRPQSVLWAQRRHRLHLLERRAGVTLGICSWPACPLLPGRASWPQYRRQDGHSG